MALLAAAGTDTVYIIDFLPGLALFGIGMAVVIPPLTKCALSVPPAFSGSASGINNGVARVGGLLAVAVLGVIMLTAFTAHLAGSLARSAISPEQQQEILAQSAKLGDISIPGSFGEIARQQALDIIDDAFVYGFRWAMALCSGLALTGAVVAAVTIRGDIAAARRPGAPRE